MSAMNCKVWREVEQGHGGWPRLQRYGWSQEVGHLPWWTWQEIRCSEEGWGHHQVWRWFLLRKGGWYLCALCVHQSCSSLVGQYILNKMRLYTCWGATWYLQFAVVAWFDFLGRFSLSLSLPVSLSLSPSLSLSLSLSISPYLSLVPSLRLYCKAC